MAAITWRNIEAPSLGDPSRTLQGAQQGFNNAFATLGDMLKGYQANEAKNWDITKVNNTEAFLAEAATKFRTPEEFKAALASGQLQGMAGANGAQIDQTAVRNFMDTRLSTLQQRTTAENVFTDQLLDRQMQPLVQQATALAAKGDEAGFNALVAGTPGLDRYIGTLTKNMVDGQRGATKFKWEGEDQQIQLAAEGRAAALAPLQQAQIRASTNASNAAAESSRNSSKVSAAQLKATQAELLRTDKLTEASRKQIIENGPLAGGYLGTGDGLQKLQAGTKNIPGLSDGQSEEIQAALQEIAAKGGIPVEGADGKTYRVPVSVSAALSAISASGSGWWLRDKGRANQVVETLTEMYQKPDFQSQLRDSMVALKLNPAAEPAAAKEKSFTEALGFGASAPAAATAAAKAPGVALSDQWKTGNAAVDDAFSQELARRGKTMIPGLVLTPDGALDPRSDPAVLTQIRNQVIQSLPKPTEAQKKSLKQ